MIKEAFRQPLAGKGIWNEIRIYAVFQKEICCTLPHCCNIRPFEIPGVHTLGIEIFKEILHPVEGGKQNPVVFIQPLNLAVKYFVGVHRFNIDGGILKAISTKLFKTCNKITCLLPGSGNNDFLAEKGTLFKPVNSIPESYHLTYNDKRRRFNVIIPDYPGNSLKCTYHRPLFRCRRPAHHGDRSFRIATMFDKILNNYRKIFYPHIHHKGSHPRCEFRPVDVGGFLGRILMSGKKGNSGCIISMGYGNTCIGRSCRS